MSKEGEGPLLRDTGEEMEGWRGVSGPQECRLLSRHLRGSQGVNFDQSEASMPAIDQTESRGSDGGLIREFVRENEC